MRLKKWKATAYNMFQLPSMLRLHKRGLLIAEMENPPLVEPSAGDREENAYLNRAKKGFKAPGIPGCKQISTCKPMWGGGWALGKIREGLDWKSQWHLVDGGLQSLPAAPDEEGSE